MKRFLFLCFSLLALSSQLSTTAIAQNRLKDKTEATQPAADDWLYLDGATNGVRKLKPTALSMKWLAPVVGVESVNINISNPTATTTYSDFSTPYRLLLAGQSDATQNGVYIYSGNGVAMTRATDADTWAEIAGSAVRSIAQLSVYYNDASETTGALGSTQILYQREDRPDKLSIDGGTLTAGTLAGATDAPGTFNRSSLDTITITTNAGVIDVTKGDGSATNGAATTLTFSTDNVAATRYLTRTLINSDGSNARVFTFDTATDFTVTVPAASSVVVSMKSQGASGWARVGGASNVVDLSADTTPATTKLIETVNPTTGGSQKSTIAQVLSGNVTNITVSITADGLSDDTYTGATLITGKNAGATIAQWDLVYLNSSGAWVLCDADAGTPLGITGMIGLAVTSGTNGNPLTVLQKGFVRNDGWAWTAGSRLYASGTAGGMTHTAPSTATNAIMVVGAAITDDEIWFDGTLIWAIKG